MEYTVVSAAKMPKLIEEVNDLIAQGWMPLEGGFQVQNFTDTSVRYLQAMVKVFPWSIERMMTAIKAATVPTIDIEKITRPKKVETKKLPSPKKSQKSNKGKRK